MATTYFKRDALGSFAQALIELGFQLLAAVRINNAGLFYRHDIKRLPISMKGSKLGLLHRGRQSEKDRSPLPRLTLCQNSTTVQLDNVFHDTKTQPGAALFARTALIHPIESLENMR